MHELWIRRISMVSTLLLFAFPTAFNRADEPPKSLLAKKIDLEFSVDYSTDRLMLGDILYAKVTIRNATDQTKRLASFNYLIISAKCQDAVEILYHAGEYPSGVQLLELAPNKEIVQYQILDVFGNDRNDDGEFNPFNAALEGQPVSLQAEQLTVMPHLVRDLDYREYVMTHKHKIEFGPPLIAKAAFDEAVAEKLKRPDLKPLKLYFDYLQSSYFFDFTTDRRDLEGNRRAFAAGLKVMSEEFPKQSSARRASSILLLVDKFIDANEDVEDQVVSAILSHIAGSPVVERHFWRSYLLRKFKSEEAIGYGGFVSKRKHELLSRRLNDAEF